MTLEELQKLLKKHHIAPNKTFGQNFLMDESVLEEMLDAAKVDSSSTVLEVGPGIGNLTECLAKRASRVLAVEKDTHFRSILGSIMKRYTNVSVEYADILRYDFTAELERLQGNAIRYKVVANIPYYVTGKIVQLFLRAPKRPESITILVQKEVAENMVAGPGRMNLLGLSVQLLGAPRLVCVVPGRSFYPAPKVDSAVVHIDIPQELPYPNVNEKLFFQVAKACFAGKRKQIHNSLKAGLNLTAEEVNRILNTAHITPTARPQDVSVVEFVKLTDIVFKHE